MCEGGLILSLLTEEILLNSQILLRMGVKRDTTGHMFYFVETVKGDYLELVSGPVF